jgi:hypothetical protein
MAHYHELLKNPKWRKRCSEIIEAAGSECMVCGIHGSGDTLHIDHCYYEKGKAPWEYPDSAYRCLCEECGDLAENRKLSIGVVLSETSADDDMYGYGLGAFAFEKQECLIDVSSYEIASGLSNYWGLNVDKHVIPYLLKSSGKISGDRLLGFVARFGAPTKPWLERIAREKKLA